MLNPESGTDANVGTNTRTGTETDTDLSHDLDTDSAAQLWRGSGFKNKYQSFFTKVRQANPRGGNGAIDLLDMYSALLSEVITIEHIHKIDLT